MPLDIFAKPLIQASDAHKLFTTLLCLDASFAMTPPTTSRFPLKLQPGFETQTQKSSSRWLEQTTKPLREAYPLCLLHDLDMCYRHPRPPDHQVLLRLRLTWLSTISIWSIRSTPHILLLVDAPSVSHHDQSFNHLGSSIHASCLFFTAPSPSTRHISAWPSLYPSIVSMLYTCTLA